MSTPILSKPFSSRCILANEWAELKHWSANEFLYPQYMGYEFMHWLDDLRELAGVSIITTSGYRTKIHNENIGGAEDSAHCDIPCNAVDIGERPTPGDKNWNCTRYHILTTALKLGCTRIGLYANGSIHLDMTADKRPGERIWRIVGSLPLSSAVSSV